jgi:ribose 5-phosphate isomerase A
MEIEKLASAKEALKFVKDGMTIGLGSGSTAEIFIELLGEKSRKENLNLSCIPTSISSMKKAKKEKLKVVGFNQIEKIDIAFDGADQVDKKKFLLKGLGGALVKEKIVDYRAEKFVVMVGENKLVKKLNGIVPVEVIPMAEEVVKKELIGLGAQKCDTRMEGKKRFISENSNLIIHSFFEKIENPKKLEEEINEIVGVVDNGIFSKKKPIVLVGKKDASTYRF